MAQLTAWLDVYVQSGVVDVASLLIIYAITGIALIAIAALTVAGTAFGGVGTDHIRISYANSRENLTEALGRIGRFVEGLGRG